MVALDLEPRRAPVDFLEQPCRSALNRVKGMPFKWSLNPYMGCEHRCTFCYVRAFEKRADRPADDRYGRAVRVKVNVAAVLRQELGRRTWRGESIAIGAATDPYQPAEGRYRLTRACLEVLAELANPMGLITRGPLVVRDVDVLTALARRAEAAITFSIPTLDTDVWRRTEPGTAHPRQRLRAVERLAAAGLRVSVGMAPILPGISDGPAAIEEVVRAARAAGAGGIWANLLYLRPGTREHFMESLGRHWPHLVPSYEQLYSRGFYLPGERVRPVQSLVRDLTRRHLPSMPVPTLRPEPRPQQLSLLLERGPA